MATVTATVWLNGQIMDAETATVGVLDHGLTVGDGVFETCKYFNGEAFALTRHLRRLSRSADILGLKPPSEAKIRTAIKELLNAAAPLPRGRLRITLTGGVGPLGSPRGTATPTLIVALSPTAPWPEKISAVTVDWTRNERSAVAGAKTTSYAENVVAVTWAQRHGAGEALLANTRGLLCEGTGSNVFVELDGVLATPTLSSGCLAGVTRELLLEWARDAGLPILERDLAFEVVQNAESVLLTSSTRDAQIVNQLNGRAIPVGPLGLSAVRLFADRTVQDIDP